VKSGVNEWYYHIDGLGSIAAMTDTTGATAQTYSYDSFGNLTNQTGGILQPFTYTGREYDTETGLYFYRARYYDPQAGRFISQDPIVIAGGINLYAYVDSIGITTGMNLYTYTGNNPINKIDPLGLAEEYPTSLYGPPASLVPWPQRNFNFCISSKTKCQLICKAAFVVPSYAFGIGVGLATKSVQAGSYTTLGINLYTTVLCVSVCKDQ
jgi:RHS repeat-associated protein